MEMFTVEVGSEEPIRDPEQPSLRELSRKFWEEVCHQAVSNRSLLLHGIAMKLTCSICSDATQGSTRYAVRGLHEILTSPTQILSKLRSESDSPFLTPSL